MAEASTVGLHAKTADARQGGRQGGPQFPAGQGARQNGGAAGARRARAWLRDLCRCWPGEDSWASRLNRHGSSMTLCFGLRSLSSSRKSWRNGEPSGSRRQAQALAVKVDAVQEGYFRIGPYLDTAEDRAKFDRADRAHEKVLDWITRADAMPLYLTGDFRLGQKLGSERLCCRRFATRAGPSSRRASGRTRRRRLATRS